VCLISVACATAGGIPFADDEGSMELAARPGLDAAGLKYNVERLAKDQSDVFITLRYGDADYNFMIVLDTASSAKDRSERSFRVLLRTGLYTRSPQGYLATVDRLNNIAREYWTGHFYVDEDGEILGLWAINIGKGYSISDFQIPDMVQRLAGVWFDEVANVKSCTSCDIGTSAAGNNG